MAVLISAGGALGGPNGGERRCDATCHGAKQGTRCVCICGGRYHAGGSYTKVVERHTDDWLAGRTDLAPQPLPPIPNRPRRRRTQPPALFART